jgi:hypothetical protein
MATSHAINYRDAYFKYPELTCIEGEPRAEHLIQLNKELKSNAISVYSNLGGAQHGHLFLVMTPVQYSMISATPFVRPPHPGPLHIEPGTTQHMATTLKEEHKEKLRLFHEVEGAEKALIQQIVKAVRPEYLNALCNRSTNLITGPVYNIIDHLSSTYGRVTAQMFDDKSEELRQMTYDPSQPIDNIFTAVNELADFAELARNNITQRQCVSRAYLILNKSGKLKEAITEWNHKTTANQNWINFKVHFRQAHNEYRETSNMTLEQAEREQNNAQLVQQIMEGGVQNALPPASSTSTDELTEEVANVATQVNHQSQVIPHLIQQMQQMQTLTQQLQQQPPHYHQFPPPFHNQHFHQPPPPPKTPHSILGTTQDNLLVINLMEEEWVAEAEVAVVVVEDVEAEEEDKEVEVVDLLTDQKYYIIVGPMVVAVTQEQIATLHHKDIKLMQRLPINWEEIHTIVLQNDIVGRILAR